MRGGKEEKGGEWNVERNEGCREKENGMLFGKSKKNLPSKY